MANKETVVFLADKGAYQIQYKDGKGNTMVRDTIPTVEALPQYKAVEVFQGYAKDEVNRRRAAMSLLAVILEFGGESLSAYKGAQDPAKPLPKELKDSFKDAEAAYFKQYMHPDHPDHKGFIAHLPKINARQEQLEVGGKLNPERQFQYFLTTLREAPAYANAKNIVLSFWAYCGQSPMGADGRLLPPEAIRVMVANVRVLTPADNSLKARLYAIRRELMAENISPPDDDLPEIVATLRETLEYCQTLATAAATRATTRVKPGDVVQQTKDAITDAGAKIPANGPTEGKTVKAKDHTEA